MFAGIVVFCTALLWPQLSTVNTIHTKSTFSPTVTIFNAWTVGWNANRLQHGFSDYWQAPIFAPEKSAFAFSEPQPATMLVAPVVWATGSELIGYKAWLLLSLIGNGIATVLLCRHLKFHQLTQLTAAVAMILLPIAQQRIDVVQLIPIWGILWFFRCVLMLHSGAGIWKAIECGFAYAVCFWICVHHALFLSLLMPFCSVVFLAKLRHRQFAIQSCVAVAVAALLIAPIILPIAAAANDHQFERNADLVKRQAAMPIHYLSSQSNSLFSPLKTNANSARQLCVGWVRMLAAVLGILLVLRHHESRRWGLFFILMAVFAFCFSLGPNLQAGNWSPWNSVANYVPGFRQVRNPFRFAWFVQIAVVLLATKTLDEFAHRVFPSQAAAQRPADNPVPAKPGRRYQQVAVVCMAILLAVEIWPQPTTAHPYPNAAAHQDWTSFVRANRHPNGNIACLPLPASSKLKDYLPESTWMIHGLAHNAPMLNGYSGFFPSSYLNRLSLYRQEGLGDAFLQNLIDSDTDLIVVQNQSSDGLALPSVRSKICKIQLVYSGESGIDVYRLQQTQD